MVPRALVLAGALLLGALMPFPAHAQSFGLQDNGRFVYLPDKTPPEEVPAWLHEIPAPDGLPGARRDFQIIAPRTGLDLAITISFDEPESADRLLAYFRGARTGRTVAANLLQGTGLPNQRTIILRNRLLDSPGVLSLTADGPELLIWRMEFQWMQARAVMVPLGSALEAPAAVLNDGHVLHYDELASGEDRSPQEEWLGNIIRFPLIDAPQRVESGVEYVFTLDSIPRAAILHLDVTGLPPGAQTRLMVNGKVAGWLQMALPSLAHGGYRTADDLGGGTELAGWRNAQAWIPTSLLVPGENSVWMEYFERSDEAPAEGETPGPGSGLQTALMFGVAARHMFLEMDYTPAAETNAPEEAPAEMDTASTDGSATNNSSTGTPAEHLALSDDTADGDGKNDDLPDEQTAAQPVTLKGELRYDLMGDMAPALMLFMEETPAAPNAAVAPAPAETAP